MTNAVPTDSGADVRGSHWTIDPYGVKAPGADVWNGSAVTDWADNSGHGNTLIRESTSPTYNANGLATGRPSLSCGGSAGWRTAPGLALPTGSVLWAMTLHKLTTQSDYYRVFSAAAASGSDVFGGVIPIIDSTDGASGHRASYFYTFNEAHVDFTTGAFALIEGVPTSLTAATMLKNEVSGGESATIDMSAISIDRVGLGVTAHAGSEGAYMEAVEHHWGLGILTSTQREFTASCALWNNGLQALLPSGSTYYSVRPTVGSSGTIVTYDAYVPAAVLAQLAREAGPQIDWGSAVILDRRAPVEVGSTLIGHNGGPALETGSGIAATETAPLAIGGVVVRDHAPSPAAADATVSGVMPSPVAWGTSVIRDLAVAVSENAGVYGSAALPVNWSGTAQALLVGDASVPIDWLETVVGEDRMPTAATALLIMSAGSVAEILTGADGQGRLPLEALQATAQDAVTGASTITSLVVSIAVALESLSAGQADCVVVLARDQVVQGETATPVGLTSNIRASTAITIELRSESPVIVPTPTPGSRVAYVILTERIVDAVQAVRTVIAKG